MFHFAQWPEGIATWGVCFIVSGVHGCHFLYSAAVLWGRLFSSHYSRCCGQPWSTPQPSERDPMATHSAQLLCLKVLSTGGAESGALKLESDSPQCGVGDGGSVSWQLCPCKRTVLRWVLILGSWVCDSPLDGFFPSLFGFPTPSHTPENPTTITHPKSQSRDLSYQFHRRSHSGSQRSTCYFAQLPVCWAQRPQ
jgi:hypothetical protein